MDTLLNKMAKSSTANCAINIKTLNKIWYVCIDLKCRFLVAFLVCVITFCHAGWQVTHHDMQKKLILMTYCWLTSTSKQYVTLYGDFVSSMWLYSAKAYHHYSHMTVFAEDLQATVLLKTYPGLENKWHVHYIRYFKRCDELKRINSFIGCGSLFSCINAWSKNKVLLTQ